MGVHLASSMLDGSLIMVYGGLIMLYDGLIMLYGSMILLYFPNIRVDNTKTSIVHNQTWLWGRANSY